MSGEPARINVTLAVAASALGLALMAGCAKHADFLELREEVANLAKANEQTQKRLDTVQRRSPDAGKPMAAEEVHKGSDAGQQRWQELSTRLGDLEHRLARLEEGQASAGSRTDDATRQAAKPQPPSPRAPDTQEAFAPLPGTPSISPTSAFNLAYNDYLNGRFDLAITGFQRFLKDFSNTSLVPNAHYWIGESYFSLKDYPRAMQAFQKVVSEYPRSEKVAPALFKLGVVAAEAGDLPKARSYLRRVVEEFSTSDEAKLAKNKLAEIR
jgi:tol-pal system protein YbgF